MKTRQEYEQKYFHNQRITGFGLGVTLHVPCPFCAEPDFLIYKIIEMESALTSDHVCKHCGRGMKTFIERDKYGGTKMEFVQTCGDDPPDFLPKMRRIQ